MIAFLANMLCAALRFFQRLAQSLALAVIALWQSCLSPMFGDNCRFYPSCSHYAQEAISRQGVFIGSLRALWRILRCNSLSAGGFDPVEKEFIARADVAAPNLDNRNSLKN